MSTISGIFTQAQNLIDTAIAAPTTTEKNKHLQDLKKMLTTDVVFLRLQAIESEPTYLIPLPEKADLRFTKQ